MGYNNEIKIVKRFVLVGILTTLFHILCANAALVFMDQFDVSAAKQMIFSNAFGFICCNVTSYFFYANWTFEVGATRQSISKFKFVALFSFSTILFFTVIFERVGFTPIALTFFITLPLGVINFFVHRLWTFR